LALILYIAAIKYSFAQADEILPKINAFKQHYLRKQEQLFTVRVILRRSCDVAYSSAQTQLVFRSVRHFFGIIILMTFVATLDICGVISSLYLYGPAQHVSPGASLQGAAT